MAIILTIMRKCLTVLTVAGMLAATACAEEVAQKAAAGQPELAKLKTSVFKNKVTQLTDKQIAELYETYKDPKTGREYRLIASIGKNPRNKKATAYRLTATLYEYKTYRGKKIGQRQNGKIHIYVLDDAGKMVDQANVSLSKMCPG